MKNLSYTNLEWFDRAKLRIPGGVDSPVRSFSSVGGTPFTAIRGEGSYIYDVEGNRYLDFVQSYGALLLGHAHRVVTEAIQKQSMLGTTFGTPTRGEVLLAEAICERVASCDKVRFVSSGTEAAMSAVRLARGFTGRDRVVKFDGCYHGHSDLLLAGGGSGVASLGLPGSAGVPKNAVADTMVVPYNVLPELDDRVACVIVEPVAANMGLVLPCEGFLSSLRRSCDAVGALLIFDEVITGFRLGETGASGWFGVVPDLWCFGKVIGGGLPIGAFGGCSEIMESLAPNGPVYQAGTLSGNPLATAAGLAVLEEVSPKDYDELSARVGNFAKSLEESISTAGLNVCVSTCGPLVGINIGTTDPNGEVLAPSDYESARQNVTNGYYVAFFHAMLKRGVFLAPGGYEVLFPGLAHTPADLNKAVEVAGEAALEVVASLS